MCDPAAQEIQRVRGWRAGFGEVVRLIPGVAGRARLS